MYGVLCDWTLPSFFQSKDEADKRAESLAKERSGKPFDISLGTSRNGRRQIWVYRLQLMTNNKGEYSYEYDGTDAEYR